jgi:hypothetical protein
MKTGCIKAYKIYPITLTMLGEIYPCGELEEVSLSKLRKGIPVQNPKGPVYCSCPCRQEMLPGDMALVASSESLSELHPPAVSLEDKKIYTDVFADERHAIDFINSPEGFLSIETLETLEWCRLVE